MGFMLSIKTALNHLKELNCSYVDTEGYGFMEDVDFVKANNICKYPENKWNIQVMQNAWNILDIYQEYLSEIDTTIEAIERPESIENTNVSKTKIILL